ncbi:hypothetical protein N9Y05_01290 [Candidatus Pelagibacter bacterium]|nr:hypothetical protein [Candidatus Pelagibacter bacterium]MDB2696555.1 hypothetical protein [Candidatus Pelagibacter bacterium]
MKDLDKKLKIIEQETIDEKIRKKALREKAEERQSKIHLEFINIWEKEVLSNKQFISDLDKILKTFKKIRPKNNRYSWKFFEGNINIKEKVKDEVAFYLNDQKISLNLILSGKDSEIYLMGESFDIKNIDKVKDDYLQFILDVFKDEGDNSF